MSNKIPFFSIVIPTYNHAHFIGKCLESILSQSFQNWEAIVINNFSDDNTIEIVESYNDPRIHLVNNANGGIIAVSRNKGISLACGEWISFLDSDDWWYSNKLEVLHQYISDNPQVDFVCHDLIMHNILSGKKRIMSCGPIAPNLYRDLLMYGNRFINSASSIKKTTIDNFNIKINESKNFISVEDYDLYLQLAALNAIFACINTPLGEYIVDNNNMSISNIHLTNIESVLEIHVFEKQVFEPNKSTLWRKVSSRLNIIKATASYGKGKYFETIVYLLKSIILSPGNFTKYAYHKII